MKLFILIMCLLPSSLFAAGYTEILEQFKAKNSKFSRYELIEKPLSSDRKDKYIAAKGDVDNDGFEDVIFGIQDITDDKESSKRVVIMTGMADGSYRTLLVNKPIAEYRDYFTVQIISVCCSRTTPRKFLIGAHSGGFASQKGLGSSRYIELTLKQDVLLIDYLLYTSPWRVESAAPNHAYLYDFRNLTYEEEWEALAYNPDVGEKEPVAKRETGTFKLTEGFSTLYLKDGTNPFRVVVMGEKDITPQLIIENTIRTPQ